MQFHSVRFKCPTTRRDADDDVPVFVGGLNLGQVAESATGECDEYRLTPGLLHAILAGGLSLLLQTT